MSIMDKNLDFALTSISSSTADTVSTNVLDRGAAELLFPGPGGIQFGVYASITAGTSPTVRARLVGADNAALTTNPEILADSGVHTLKDDGTTALASGDKKFLTLVPRGQTVPKRYYGLIFTMGGTTPSGDFTPVAAIDIQTNQVGAKLATP